MLSHFGSHTLPTYKIQKRRLSSQLILDRYNALEKFKHE